MSKTFASKGERIYIDTNILVYFFFSKYRRDFTTKSIDLLKKIENNKYEGVISSLTLMELIKSLRELLITHGNLRGMKDIEETIKQCISKLFIIKNIRILEGHGPTIFPMSETKELRYCTVSREALDIMCRCSGKCDYDSYGKLEHKGLHAPDVLHVVLAKKCKCDKLATFEWNFNQTKKEISPLILQDRNAFW